MYEMEVLSIVFTVINFKYFASTLNTVAYYLIHDKWKSILSILFRNFTEVCNIDRLTKCVSL